MLADDCGLGLWTLLENQKHWEGWADEYLQTWFDEQPLMYPCLAFQTTENSKPWPAYLYTADVMEMAIAFRLLRGEEG